MKYHLCGVCKKEFFDDETFFKHPCVCNNARGVNDVNINDLEKQIKKFGGKALLDGLTDPMAIRDLAEKLKREHELSAKNDNNSAPEKTPEVTAESLAKRAEATAEMKRMKHELKEAGIEANTLSADQTKAEYDAMKARQSKAPKQPKTASDNG